MNQNKINGTSKSPLSYSNKLTNLDKREDIIKVITNVLLNNSNQDSQLLEKELSEIDISCSYHIEETWHHMRNVGNTLYAQ